MYRALTVAAVLAAVLGCTSGDGSKKIGEACTRDRNCRAELECVGGVCRDPNEDAATPDGAAGE